MKVKLLLVTCLILFQAVFSLASKLADQYTNFVYEFTLHNSGPAPHDIPSIPPSLAYVTYMSDSANGLKTLQITNPSSSINLSEDIAGWNVSVTFAVPAWFVLETDTNVTWFGNIVCSGESDSGSFLVNEPIFSWMDYEHWLTASIGVSPNDGGWADIDRIYGSGFSADVYGIKANFPLGTGAPQSFFPLTWPYNTSGLAPSVRVADITTGYQDYIILRMMQDWLDQDGGPDTWPYFAPISQTDYSATNENGSVMSQTSINTGPEGYVLITTTSTNKLEFIKMGTVTSY
jgi:hypothetical protein